MIREKAVWERGPHSVCDPGFRTPAWFVMLSLAKRFALLPLLVSTNFSLEEGFHSHPELKKKKIFRGYSVKILLKLYFYD